MQPQNVLNTALPALTSSQPESAEDETHLPFPKEDGSVGEFKERSVLGPKTTFIVISSATSIMSYVV